MNNYAPLFLLISLIFINCRSQSYISFSKKMNVDNIDRGVTVIESLTGDFMITGTSAKSTEANPDLLLIQTDKTGHIKWTKNIGEIGNDNGWAIRQVSDENFIVVGYTDGQGAGGMDVSLTKIDQNGNELWTKTFGGEGDEYGWDIRKTNDEGFIIASETNSKGNGEIDAYLIKTDSNGNIEWANTYGGAKTDRIFSVRQTPDGGYIATGITYSYGDGSRDVYLLKVNAKGQMDWFKSYGGPGYDVGHYVTLGTTNGYLITGYGESFATHGKRDIYLIKTDDRGEIQWQKSYGGPENERAMKGEQTKDGGYIVVGFTQVPDGQELKWDVYLMKTDQDGEKIWSRTYGEIENYDIGYTVVQTNDGGFIITGHSINPKNQKSSVLLIKTDNMGQFKNDLK